ncbi:hypothetical protein F2P56_013078 [Juglans regia]|uniref:Protein CHUP1, chloroplastic-like n=2 Tax=Juglans regia TaxID=51240 RepID=A0A2I4GSP8_JUGRE|nr:protein CHUP1, chloroplastic-like [Juglans regia]KAF5468972.1 hypothetical protein F2P56_013078 [Juglans regia]
MIIRVSCLVVASVAAFSFSQRNVGSSWKQNTVIRLSETHESDLQQQQIQEKEEENLKNPMLFDEEEEENTMTKIRGQQNLKPSLAGKKGSEEFEFLIHDKDLSNVTEMGLVQSLVKEMEQRKVTIEGKQLELYGLKEQQLSIEHLRRQLEDKTTEIDMLKITIKSLQVERKKLHEQIKEGFIAEKQLEMAKKMLKGMQEKIEAKGSQVMGRLMVLQEQVSNFKNDDISFRDTMVEKKLEAVENVGLEVAEIKRMNKELELEKRELAIKLIVAKARIAALSNMTEDKMMAKAKEELSSLKHANEELQDQVERLQKNRFNMVEELVYQRWIHTCLRFEIQNHQNQSIETSKCDSSKASSQKSHEKTKSLMSDPRFDSISSDTSAESDEIYSSTTYDSSSSSQRSTAKRLGVILSMKRWGRSKDDRPSRGDSLSRSGLIHRFFMSMVPSKQPMLRKTGDGSVITLSKKQELQDSNKSEETLTFQRIRPVSFNDSVKSMEYSTYLDMPKSNEEMSDGKKNYVLRSRFEGEKHESSSATLATMMDDHSSSPAGECIKNSINTHEGNRTEIAHGDELLHSRMFKVRIFLVITGLRPICCNL